MNGLPPNQVWAKRWIVYSALNKYPEIDLSEWRLNVGGLVENKLSLSFRELEELGLKKVSGGFHCVEGWSIREVVWEGVPIKRLADKAKPLPETRWVLFKSIEGYTAISPLEDIVAENSIIALRLNGSPLLPEHGFPARPIIPHLYAWKSVKWLTEIEFRETYIDGYWEERGYHWRGNIWMEERRKPTR